MVSLTNEDREALVAAFVNSTRNPDHVAFLAVPAVEQILARHVAEARAATWDEVAQALAWATENGPDPVRYVTENNPYRTPPP